MSDDKVRAQLSIELNVTCPECDHWFDLVSDTRLNDEGELLKEAVGENDWHAAHEHFNCSAICPECSVEFDVKGIEW